MIPVNRTEEPHLFDQNVRQKGLKWLSEHPETKRPKDFWKHCKEELATAFHNRCAYSAIEITYGGTVDHFLSCKHHRHLAYEWTNYRYCFGSINSTKQNLDEQILDPFEIEEDWFEIVIPGFMLKPTDRVPEAFYAKAKRTIDALKLNSQEMINTRLRILNQYKNQMISFAGLEEKAPLLAKTVSTIN